MSRWRQHRWRWVEVYLGTDYAEYRRKQTLLREAGLKFKAKTRRNLGRSAPAFFKRRKRGWPRNGPPVRDYYVILVRRENAADAKYLLS